MAHLKEQQNTDELREIESMRKDMHGMKLQIKAMEAKMELQTQRMNYLFRELLKKTKKNSKNTSTKYSGSKRPIQPTINQSLINDKPSNGMGYLVGYDYHKELKKRKLKQSKKDSAVSKKSKREMTTKNTGGKGTFIDLCDD